MSRRNWRVLLWTLRARAVMMIKFKLTVALNLMLQTKKQQTNKQQQIDGVILTLCVLTQFVRDNFTTLSNLSFNTAAILKICFKHLLFHRLSHSWQALIGFNQILLWVPSTRDLGTRLLGNGALTSLLLNFQIRRLWMNLNQSAATKTKATNVLYQSYSKVSESS